MCECALNAASVPLLCLHPETPSLVPFTASFYSNAPGLLHGTISITRTQNAHTHTLDTLDPPLPPSAFCRKTFSLSSQVLYNPVSLEIIVLGLASPALFHLCRKDLKCTMLCLRLRYHYLRRVVTLGIAQRESACLTSRRL